MDRLLESGYAEITKRTPNKKLWYLPHFGVSNVNKPGRVRLVFDAAAKTKSISFNDFLLAGPDLLKNLLGVFMRFREYAIAFKGGLKDMFLKIKIRENDQDAQRFLWRGRDRSIEPREYVMTSVLFRAKSSPCTALFIKNENASKFLTQFPVAANNIINNSYMDDYFDNCESVLEAKERIRTVIAINRNANWDMHGWASNEDSLNKVYNKRNLVKLDHDNETERFRFTLDS